MVRATTGRHARWMAICRRLLPDILVDRRAPRGPLQPCATSPSDPALDGLRL